MQLLCQERPVHAHSSDSLMPVPQCCLPPEEQPFFSWLSLRKSGSGCYRVLSRYPGLKEVPGEDRGTDDQSMNPGAKGPGRRVSGE